MHYSEREDLFSTLTKYSVKEIENYMADRKVIALVSGNIEAVSGPAAEDRPGAHEWLGRPLTKRKPSEVQRKPIPGLTSSGCGFGARGISTNANISLSPSRFADCETCVHEVGCRMSTRSVQLERSERVFACFSVANRAARSTRLPYQTCFATMTSGVRSSPGPPLIPLSRWGLSDDIPSIQGSY
jgi:hypothetical protein